MRCSSFLDPGDELTLEMAALPLERALLPLLVLVARLGLAALSFFSFGFGPTVRAIAITTLRQSVTPD